MSTDKRILTIAIPTYNRPQTLKVILNELVRQKNDQVVVLISDDSSNSEIEHMVPTYKHSLPTLKYVKNKKNLGFSGNVCSLYELADTRYIWFLCDDDTVLPGAVEKILEFLVTNEPVVAVFNHEQLNPYGEMVLGSTHDTKIYNSITELKNYQPLQRTTFLSVLVVEKRCSVTEIKKQDFTDNIFFQVILSLVLLSDKFKFCEVDTVILRRNVGYKYGEFFKFYLIDHLKAVHLVKHSFDNKKFIEWSKKELKTALLLYLSQKAGLFIYEGRPTKKTLRTLTKYYGLSSLLIFMFIPIKWITPAILIKTLYFAILVSKHGYQSAKKIYCENINRAYTDIRDTGFTSYK